MVLTKSYIDELTRDYNIEVIDFKSRLEEEHISLQISEEDLKYLVTKLCDMREELDYLYEEREGMDALYAEMLEA